jgi:two-component system sensor histidine kinase PilS (NtrC family)
MTARLLASRVVANEQLARRRGAELDRQLRINERIIRDMSTGVIVADIDGRVGQVNPAATTLLGVNLAGCSLHELGADFMAQFGGWAATPGTNVAVIRAPSGRALRVRYLPAEDGPGKGLLYLEDLDQVQVQAQQLKLAALGRLTANIAHEIRNPLAAISHAAELLGEEDTDPLRTRLARIVGDNTHRLNKLVTDVLELGRRDRAEPELLHWQAFATALIEELALHDPSVSQRVELEGEDVVILFDRGHLHRVLWNLTTNALRHATAAAGAIRLSAVAVDGGELVAIQVSDDGPGIGGELRNQVFEPFFTTRSTGTGLGLYIARELCEANGAVLELLEAGPGANFRIMAKGVR